MLKGITDINKICMSNTCGYMEMIESLDSIKKEIDGTERVALRQYSMN